MQLCQVTMAKSTKAKRTYNSTRRLAQARQTRRAILEAARTLFYQKGYGNATIEAIAQEAEVATETIYAIFGNKQTILKDLVGITLVGDDEPVPLLERPDIRAATKATDQREVIHQFAAGMYQIMSRMSPIFSLLRTTAKTDPEIAAIQTKLLAERLAGMSFFIEQVRRITQLRQPLFTDQLKTTVWAISSAEVFDLLTRDQGWSQELYVSWLDDALTRLLLP
jgi:AcrR family transcriptional regulator